MSNSRILTVTVACTVIVEDYGDEVMANVAAEEIAKFAQSRDFHSGTEPDVATQYEIPFCENGKVAQVSISRMHHNIWKFED